MKEWRVGTGYDIHRLVEGRALIMGGVTVPYDKGLYGHSDGDVLAHAIAYALLGAAALGNIGRLFPDTDPKYKGADSLVLLSETVRLIGESGYRIVNVDASVIAERPKLNPHVDMMREKLAISLGISSTRISVKPRTNEGVGPEGRGEAIAVHAVAMVEHNDSGPA